MGFSFLKKDVKMNKLWTYLKIATNVGFVLFGLWYLVINFSAMMPTLAAIVILVVIFKLFGWEKKPPTK